MHKPKNPELRYRRFDVGVDANDYYPVSIRALADKLGIAPRFCDDGVDAST